MPADSQAGGLASAWLLKISKADPRLLDSSGRNRSLPAIRKLALSVSGQVATKTEQESLFGVDGVVTGRPLHRLLFPLPRID